MIKIEDLLNSGLNSALRSLYSAEVSADLIQIQKTRKEFEGNYTIVVFPLIKLSKKNPEQTAGEIGNYLLENFKEIGSFNVIKGFLNLSVHPGAWMDIFTTINTEERFGFRDSRDNLPSVMVEYSSPNTNKPLHLGHIRNNLLGFSLSRILEAVGRDVRKVNLINDRGIHICKSMLAWEKFGEGETPLSTGKKGDHLVGDYYVRFDQAYKAELKKLAESGLSREAAEDKSKLMSEAREMLRRWENDDRVVRKLWQEMNGWVYEGFDQTYQRLGVKFDKIYYESETYKLGKDLVLKGLEKGVFYRKPDGSVWVDLQDDGLDSKLLLRSDGTSVYMTQDLGTAHQRFTEFNLDKHIYVVGNEQNYHFQVLVSILKKLGFNWAEKIYHLSYGMVELPEGRMKSREGTVVDADILMDEMIKTAREMSDELGKLSEIKEDQKEEIFYQVGMGALKYFILKVDPKKNMVFNPAESIDFNGNTGPFIQYTYARIRSVLRKNDFKIPPLPEDYSINLTSRELSIIALLYEFPDIIDSAANDLNPSIIANFIYELAREFNQFYHDHSILNAEDENMKNFRLNLSNSAGQVLKNGMYLLGIEVPERM